MSDETRHAIAGIVCDGGNVVYNGEEICFIESTKISPIGDDNDIKIEGYVKISDGNNIYREKNYGKKSAAKVNKNYELIKRLYSQLQTIKERLLLLEKRCAKLIVSIVTQKSQIAIIVMMQTFTIHML